MRRSVRRDDAAGLAVLQPQPHREAAGTCTSYHMLLLVSLTNTAVHYEVFFSSSMIELRKTSVCTADHMH
jgi:hypothetical protein